MADTFRTPAQVHHELSETISQLGWAEIYSRTAGLDQIDASNAAAFRRKLDRIVSEVQAIEGRLPKPKEVEDVQRTAA